MTIIYKYQYLIDNLTNNDNRNWWGLSENSNAIHLLETNVNKIIYIIFFYFY